MALPSSTFRCTPVAVITNSSKFWMVGCSLKFNVTGPPDTSTDLLTDLKPKKNVFIVWVPSETLLIVYFPSPSVDVPRVVPSIITVTPAKGSPVLASVIAPVILPSNTGGRSFFLIMTWPLGEANISRLVSCST